MKQNGRPIGPMGLQHKPESCYLVHVSIMVTSLKFLQTNPEIGASATQSGLQPMPREVAAELFSLNSLLCPQEVVEDAEACLDALGTE